MHDLIAKHQPLSWVKACLLLLCLSFSLASEQVFAVIDGNVACTVTSGSSSINLGTVAPLQPIRVTMTATCRVTRAFPSGASLSYTQLNAVGNGSKFYVYHEDSGMGVPEGPIGTTSYACMPTRCVPLTVGTTFTYRVTAAAPAPRAPGYYVVALNLFVTSLFYENYGDYPQAFTMSYAVTQPPCTVSSGNTLNLPFGTLSSNDFASAQQIANVALNCTKGTQATATLVPTQSAVSGSPGVSATTLAGLSMVATWADDDSAVTFNSPRTLSLTSGTNNVRLGFRPRLNNGVSPTGSFSSQYTLNITYL